MMNLIESIKLIAETIAAISTALIVLLHLAQKLPKPVKCFFTKNVPMFFCGYTASTGKKFRFFKAIKAYKEEQEQWQNIVHAVDSDSKVEEILVLNQQELFKFLSESKLFTKVSRRAQ